MIIIIIIREKSSLVLGATFLKRVIETGGNESRFHVFDSTAGNVIERPLNRDDFYQVLYDTLPRNGEWSKICIHSNDLGYPFEKGCHPFERLGPSVWKRLSSVRTAWDIRLKKLLSVRTARAIRSEKNLSTVWATQPICSKVNFSWVSIPKPFRR